LFLISSGLMPRGSLTSTSASQRAGTMLSLALPRITPTFTVTCFSTSAIVEDSWPYCSLYPFMASSVSLNDSASRGAGVP